MISISCRRLSSWLFLILIVQAVHVCAGDVTLTTESGCYALGDTVSFTLANNRESTINMPHFPVWSIRELSSGAGIYPPAVFHSIVPMSAGTARTYSWHQVDSNHDAVAPGPYQVEVSYYEQLSHH